MKTKMISTESSKTPDLEIWTVTIVITICTICILIVLNENGIKELLIQYFSKKRFYYASIQLNYFSKLLFWFVYSLSAQRVGSHK